MLPSPRYCRFDAFILDEPLPAFSENPGENALLQYAYRLTKGLKLANRGFERFGLEL